MPAHKKFNVLPMLERAAFAAIVEGHASDAAWLDVVAPDWRTSVYVKQLQARIDAAADAKIAKMTGKRKKSKAPRVSRKRSFP